MKKMLLLLVALSAVLAACDDGRIYEKTVVIPQEGLTLKLTGNISGLDKWPEKYSVVMAGFTDDSEYAVISQSLSASVVDDGTVIATMSGIGEEVTSLELCVINRLRRRVASLYTLDEFEVVNDTVYMNVGTVDAGMYATIQDKVFDENCTACHGSSTSAAAGLYLTEGKSYDALVGKNSAVNPDMMLVEPGDAQNSFLHIVLNRNGDTHHDHVDLLMNKASLLTLIDDWINNGAAN